MKFEKPDVLPLAFHQRQQALHESLAFNPEKLLSLLSIFETAMAKTLSHEPSQVECNQTTISLLPDGKEEGAYCVLAISEADVTVQKVYLEAGAARLSNIVSVEFMHEGVAMSLDHHKASATMLIQAATEAVKKFLGDDNKATNPIKFSVVSSIPVKLTSLSSAFFRNFHEATHEDPLGFIDVISLLNIGMERGKVAAQFIGIVNDATAFLLAGAHGASKGSPRCLMSVDVGSTVLLTYVQPNAKEFGLQCSVLDVDVQHFNGNKAGTAETNYATTLALPYCAADFEVDFAANPAFVGKKSVDRMIVAKFIPEVVRRVVIQGLQGSAPPGVWVENSMPFRGVATIATDIAPFKRTADVLSSVWSWEATSDELSFVHSTVTDIFDRSAGLVAIFVSAIAKRTGRLQPALGGVSVAVGGQLGSIPFYQQLLRKHLNSIFQRETSNLVCFVDVMDAPTIGAALLSHMIQKNQI